MRKTEKPTYPFIENGRYFNDATRQRSLLKIVFIPLKEITIFLTGMVVRLLDRLANYSHWYTPQTIAPTTPGITWLGHATFLVQGAGRTILFDPVFGDLTALFKRNFPVGVAPHALPVIDYVIISHNHPDHMDYDSLQLLYAQNPQVQFLIPVGDKAWFVKHGFKAESIHEFTWWQGYEVPGLSITFLPAYHWSGRYVLDINKSLWGSWMVDIGGQRIYMGGDTGYWHHFKEIGERFQNIDIALLPIAPCRPRRWMKKSHVGAHEAGQGFLDLGARIMVPMHWATFSFGCDRLETPINLLRAWWQRHAQLLRDKQLLTMTIGQHLPLAPWATTVVQPEQQIR